MSTGVGFFILCVGESQKSKYVTPDVLHKLQEKAEPLLTWLKTAQEESDSEEDVEDSVQFKSEKSNKTAEPKSAEVGVRGAEENEGSDDEAHRRAAPAPAAAKASAPSEEIDIDAI